MLLFPSSLRRYSIPRLDLICTPNTLHYPPELGEGSWHLHSTGFLPDLLGSNFGSAISSYLILNKLYTLSVPVFPFLKWGLCACVLNCFSRVRLFATPWTVAHQAPLSMGFFRQEYWSGLPPLGDLSNPGIEPLFLISLALAGKFFTASATWEAKLRGLISQLCPTLATPWSVACQARLSVEFSKQE